MKRKLREEIKYYEITYACTHGDKKFKPRGQGTRQISLVVLSILNSYTNHVKVKIASEAATSLWGILQKVVRKQPLGEVFYKKLLIKFYKIKKQII